MNQQIQESRQEELAWLNEEIENMIETTLADLEGRSREAKDMFTLSTVQACRMAIAREQKKTTDVTLQLMFALAIMEDMLEMPDLTLEYPEMLPESFVVAFRMYRFRSRAERQEKIREAIFEVIP